MIPVYFLKDDYFFIFNVDLKNGYIYNGKKRLHFTPKKGRTSSYYTLVTYKHKKYIFYLSGILKQAYGIDQFANYSVIPYVSRDNFEKVVILRGNQSHVLLSNVKKYVDLLDYKPVELYQYDEILYNRLKIVDNGIKKRIEMS